ncbi:hypothetical protein ARMSODRAFT_77753 [Armillaria solidipes]|uniref:Uncharacterized protein n=1 Tax=Armillaria solidipes TaxID=1076256 RepID=A0A2H3BKS3_9AGAR|nr:hypothetical protein ARMSODRAFT_77753 [Armillaria solidipes]
MNITDEDGRYLDRFVDDEGVQFEERYTCCPYCECAMLATLLQHWTIPQGPAPIIGTSKLSCFGCRLYFTAYKNAMFELPVIDLPRQFVVTGAHNTLYLPWVSPYLTSINPDLHAVVQKNLLILAPKASVEYVKSRRRYSESTTHSSVEEDMVPHKPPRREWKTGSSKSS